MILELASRPWSVTCSSVCAGRKEPPQSTAPSWARCSTTAIEAPTSSPTSLLSHQVFSMKMAWMEVSLLVIHQVLKDILEFCGILKVHQEFKKNEMLATLRWLQVLALPKDASALTYLVFTCRHPVTVTLSTEPLWTFESMPFYYYLFGQFGLYYSPNVTGITLITWHDICYQLLLKL